MKALAKPDKRTFVDAIFEVTGWSYTAPMAEVSETLETSVKSSSTTELPPEKKQILDSLKDYAVKEAIENKIQFSGGEIRVLPALKECQSETELISLWTELMQPLSQEYGLSGAIAHELKAAPIKVLFVGDYPKGSAGGIQSFTGEVRDLLLKMISAMKLSENDFALTTVVKSLPLPEGKTKELGRDSLPLLNHEILYYKPSMVVTLGAYATSLLLGTEDRLSSIHGEYFERELMAQNGHKHAYQIMPIFHPEFLLINPNMKKTTWTDLQKAMKTLGLI